MSEMITHTYRVTGMTCNSCLAKVTNMLEGLVYRAQVQRNPDMAVLEGGAAGDLQALNAALTGAGRYRLQMAELGPDVETQARSPMRTLVKAPIKLSTYRPLLLVVGLALVFAWLLSLRLVPPSFTPVNVFFMQMTNDFMGTFFLLFGFFKLLDLKGFVQAYRRYDMIAMRFAGWAKAYPFVEIALGLMFVLHVAPVLANLATLVLMLLGLVGVRRALRRGETIQCACLGTVFNLPMTTVTLVENGGMALMAAWMLLI